MPSIVDVGFEERAHELAAEAPRLLQRALHEGGNYADLFYEQTTTHRFSLRQRGARHAIGVPAERSWREDVEGAAVHVVGDAGTGFAAAEDVTMHGLLRAAAEAAGRIAGSTQAAGAMPPTPALPHLSPQADLPDGVAVSEKASLLRAAADAAFALHPGVRAVDVQYHDRVRRTLVVTSEGRLAVRVQPLIGLRVAVVLEVGGRHVEAYVVGGGACGFGCFFERPPEQLAREAVARARVLASAQQRPAGVMPVVVAGGWGGVWLHEAVGHLLEADVAGATAVQRLGTHVASSAVTLVDDGTLPGGRATAPCDDEGTPAGRTTLVREGVLAGLLTDRAQATRLDLPATGNGRRQDYRHAPLPRMTNLLLLPSDTDPEVLVAEVPDGLYVQAVGQGRVEPEQDRFSFEVQEGFRIEGGRRTAPVAGLRVGGRLTGMLERIAGVGSDLYVDGARGLCLKGGQVVPVSVGTPTVLLVDLEVS